MQPQSADIKHTPASASSASGAEASRQETPLPHRLCMTYRCENDDRRTLYFTDDGCDLLTGYSRAAFLKKQILYADLIHEEDRDFVRAKVQEGLKTHRPFQLEYRIRDATGKHKRVWEQGQGVFSLEGQLLCLEGRICDIAEPKPPELITRNDEKLLNILFDACSSAIVLLKLRPDGELVFETANKAYCELARKFRKGEEYAFSGKPRSEVLASLGIPPQWIEYEALYFKRAITQDVSVSYQLNWDIPDFSLTLGVNLRPVKDESGTCTHLLWCATDLTENRNTEPHSNDEPSRNMFFGSTVVNMSSGAMAHSNPHFVATFGYNTGQLIGQNIASLNAGGQSAISPTSEKIVSKITQKGFWSGEVKRKKENEVHFRSSASADAFKVAKPGLDALGIQEDITSRQEVKDALRSSEERLQLFIAHVPSALAMMDREMRYIAVSRRWLTDNGLGNENIIGKSYYDVFPEIPERWKAAHRRALDGEILTSEEDRFVGSDGVVHWLRWQVRPWHGIDDRIGGIVVFSEDITERKRLEKELMETRERESRRLGHELHDSVAQELVGMCFRLDRLAEKLSGPEPEQAEDAREIRASLNNSVKAIRRIVRGMSPIRMDVKELLGLLEDLRARLKQQWKLTCELIISDALPPIEPMVATQLYFIAQEASFNAVRHGKCANLALRLIADQQTILLEIEDDGLGIKLGRGDGIGLQIMKHRAQAIGAQIEIAARSSSGTRVRCILPLEKEQEEA